MRQVDYFLSEGSINAIYKDDWRGVALELRSMEPGQRCYVIGTPTTIDKDQSRIRCWQNKLIKALEDDRKNYEVKILLQHDDAKHQWLCVNRIK